MHLFSFNHLQFSCDKVKYIFGFILTHVNGRKIRVIFIFYILLVLINHCACAIMWEGVLTILVIFVMNWLSKKQMRNFTHFILKCFSFSVAQDKTWAPCIWYVTFVKDLIDWNRKDHVICRFLFQWYGLKLEIMLFLSYSNKRHKVKVQTSS